MATKAEPTGDLIDVLSLGAGVQSSMLLLMSCKGILPKLRLAIFADTGWEPRSVYSHLEWLKNESMKAGIPIRTVHAGNLREDAIAFRRMRKSRDGKRHASIPAFVKNLDGSRGIIRRQCTATYKIECIERLIKQELLGLKPRQRAPKVRRIRQWLGITSDEGQRAKPPGMWVKGKTKTVQTDMFGGKPKCFTKKVWKGMAWKSHAYPFLDREMFADRSGKAMDWLPTTYSREECLAWLARYYPGREFPRSACIGCPLRSNEEWAKMRDEHPEEFEDACQFDEEHRGGGNANAEERGILGLVGTIYLHDSLVPLRQADLTLIDNKRGSGCGVLFQMGEDASVDGLCGV